ncbi:hypothetical protein FDZ71_16425 [bacterium]|nr:MAG: hypothetical protein FDZ71_16425 [bacterium]
MGLPGIGHRERRRVYRRLKRARSDLRVAVRKMGCSKGDEQDMLERRVHLLTSRKRRLRKHLALLKQEALPVASGKTEG